MDTITLVEKQFEDGQRLIDGLQEKGVPITAACWLKPVEEERWVLYIASPLRDEKGPLKAYDAVLDVFRTLGDVCFDSSDITLVNDKHPIVRSAQMTLSRSRGGLVMRFPQGLFWGFPGDAAYVYSLTKVEIPIHGLSFRGDPSGLVHLSFEPHNPNSNYTVGTGPAAKAYPAEVGIDWIVAGPEGAMLERDAAGILALSWNLHGTRHVSSASEVLSLARLGLHGFRILREPSTQGRVA